MKIPSVFLICTLAIGGCAHRPLSAEDQRILAERKVALAAVDKERCKADGGSIRGVGSISYPVCVIPYSDAGKVCTDSSQCTGKCQAERADSGAPTTGQCQADSHDKFGCYSEIVAGVAQGTVCLD